MSLSTKPDNPLCASFPPQGTDKLLFEKNAVIASQCAHWRGNPLTLWGNVPKSTQKMEVTAIFGGNRYLVPFNWGIATPVCGLVRNDRKLEGEAAKQQFDFL